MPDMPGDMFIDKKSILYILLHGPKGNLRPYTVGPVAVLARKAHPLLSRLGPVGLAIAAAVLVGLAGVAIWRACRDEEG